MSKDLRFGFKHNCSNRGQENIKIRHIKWSLIVLLVLWFKIRSRIAHEVRNVNSKPKIVTILLFC